MYPWQLLCHLGLHRLQPQAGGELGGIGPGGAAGIQGWHIVRTALRFKIEAGEVKEIEVYELPRS